jgi:hypothetical protein
VFHVVLDLSGQRQSFHRALHGDDVHPRDGEDDEEVGAWLDVEAWAGGAADEAVEPIVVCEKPGQWQRKGRRGDIVEVPQQGAVRPVLNVGDRVEKVPVRCRDVIVKMHELMQ